MMTAVQAADTLMAQGLREEQARWQVRITRETYDRYKALIEGAEANRTPPPSTGREPWICPRCKRVNAPFMPWCDCGPKS